MIRIQTIDRRQFLKTSGVISMGVMFPHSIRPSSRLFRICLNPGSIGVQSNIDETFALATELGYEALSPAIGDVEILSKAELKKWSKNLDDQGLTWGSVGLPVQFRNSRAEFREDLKRLWKRARKCQQAGITRMNTWIMPTHQELTYLENFDLHASRLRMVAKLLSHFDIRLGLEYVGPKTLMTASKYPFISSLRDTKELIYEIGESNVGIQLDAFHWYCAEEDESDILSLTNEDIVTVDLNDGVQGRSIKEQIDQERELPGTTGIVDVKTFVDCLKKIGYDGPVIAEPFNKKLNDLPDMEAAKLTLDALRKVSGA